MACSSCRSRKLKCDNGKPCHACRLSRRKCEYAIPQKRGPKRKSLTDVGAATSEGFEQPSTIDSTTNHRRRVGLEMSSDQPSSEAYCAPLGGSGSSLFDSPSFGMPSTLDQDDSNMFDFLDTTSWDLLDLGQFERMPQQDLIDHLTNVYFECVHKYMPFVHRSRYLADIHLAPQAQPPMCLRYAIWTVASAQCQCHKEHADIFYRRARQYLESDEMKNPPLTTIAHVQCWALIAFYEANTGTTTRSWMSNRRSVALAQMLGLHQLDQQESRSLHKTYFRDDIDVEQGRRAFWASFCSDRWASAGTGLPKAINVKDITTNLPCSDGAFQNGSAMYSQSLSDAIEHGLLETAPTSAGSVVAAHMMGQIMDHCNIVKESAMRPDPDRTTLRKDHRRLDKVLTDIFLQLPRHLRFSTAQQGSSVAFFNICLHSASIYLHLAALDACLDEDKVGHRRRCRSAAGEVLLIMRMMIHLDASQMEPFTAFGLYTASTVLTRFFEESTDHEEDLNNIRFVLAMMTLLERHWSTTSAFIAQIRHDLKKYNIDVMHSNSELFFENDLIPGTNPHLKPARLLAGVIQHN